MATLTSTLRCPMIGGVPYCCHVGPNGEECSEPVAYELFTPPQSFDNNTHCCEKHLADMRLDGDVIYRIDPQTGKPLEA